MSPRKIDENTLLNLPKVELHLHLDCSLSYSIVSKILPQISASEYKNNFIAPPKCENLADFLKRTPGGIALMQTKEELELVVEDLFDQLKRENIILAEIRFAPLLHCEKGLTPENVVEIIAEKINHCTDLTGIKSGLILCTLRHFDEMQSLRTVKLVEKYITNSPVAGFDLAADEAGYPIHKHLNAFKYAIEYDLPRTAHAGEAIGVESIWESLDNFKTSRIGHGVRCIEDERLIEKLIKDNIHLEICPTCNIQTDVFKSFEDHPVDYLLKRGVSLSINTDARTTTNITLTEEYRKLVNIFNWGLEELKQCNLNAVEHSFIKGADKTKLVEQIESAYKN